MRAHAARDPPPPLSLPRCPLSGGEARSPRGARAPHPHPARLESPQRAECLCAMWGVERTCVSLRRCVSVLSALRGLREVQMEREVFSLVCCLLRLVSLLRESVYFQSTTTATRAQSHTRDTVSQRSERCVCLSRDSIERGRGDGAHFFVSPSRVLSCVSAVCVPIDNPFSTYRFRRDSAPWWWLEAVCRHACVCQSGGPLLSEP